MNEPRAYYTVWYHLYMESKNNTNDSIYKTETDSQTQKTNLRLLKGRGREGGTNRSMGLTDKNYYT